MGRPHTLTGPVEDRYGNMVYRIDEMAGCDCIYFNGTKYVVFGYDEDWQQMNIKLGAFRSLEAALAVLNDDTATRRRFGHITLPEGA